MNIMGIKYNKLVVLVHPLYYYFVFKAELKKNNEKENKRAEIILKQSLFEYRKQLMKLALNKPDVCFCLVKPNYQNEELIKEYNKLIKGFEDFAKNKIGDRFIVSNLGEPGDKEHKEFLPDKYYSMFEQRIELIGFGEYKEHCVNTWCKEYIPHKFRIKGINAVFDSLLCESSIFKYINGIGLKTKFLTKTERRKEQQLKKSNKTKNKNLNNFLKIKAKIK
jgi:hypothetical protein